MRILIDADGCPVTMEAVKIGNEYGKGKTYTSVSKADIPGLTDTSYSRIRSMMANLQKKSFFKNYSNANKKAFVFGVACT